MLWCQFEGRIGGLLVAVDERTPKLEEYDLEKVCQWLLDHGIPREDVERIKEKFKK